MKKCNNRNYRNNFQKRQPAPQVTEIHVIDQEAIKVPRLEYNRMIAEESAMDIMRTILATKKYPDGDMLRAIAGVALLEDKHE